MTSVGFAESIKDAGGMEDIETAGGSRGRQEDIGGEKMHSQQNENVIHKKVYEPLQYTTPHHGEKSRNIFGSGCIPRASEDRVCI